MISAIFDMESDAGLSLRNVELGPQLIYSIFFTAIACRQQGAPFTNREYKITLDLDQSHHLITPSHRAQILGMTTTRLTFSTNSVRNTTISNDSLGIRYDVHKESEGVEIHRWDASVRRNVRVGQFKLHAWSSDEMRIGGDTQWRAVKEWLYKPDDSKWWSTARHFVANNGVEYRWQEKGGRLVLFKVAKTNGTRTPLASFHRHHRKDNPSYLEVHDPTILGALDSIIVSFLIMERRRRDNEAAAAAAA